jgi:hypothetical protein
VLSAVVPCWLHDFLQLHLCRLHSLCVAASHLADDAKLFFKTETPEMNEKVNSIWISDNICAISLVVHIYHLLRCFVSSNGFIISSYLSFHVTCFSFKSHFRLEFNFRFVNNWSTENWFVHHLSRIFTVALHLDFEQWTLTPVNFYFTEYLAISMIKVLI